MIYKRCITPPAFYFLVTPVVLCIQLCGLVRWCSFPLSLSLSVTMSKRTSSEAELSAESTKKAQLVKEAPMLLLDVLFDLENARKQWPFTKEEEELAHTKRFAPLWDAVSQIMDEPEKTRKVVDTLYHYWNGVLRDGVTEFVEEFMEWPKSDHDKFGMDSEELVQRSMEIISLLLTPVPDPPNRESQATGGENGKEE